MGRLVYVSFLGPTNYKKVYYSFGKYLSKEHLKFVQEAELDYLNKFENRTPDSIIIFLTDEAKKMNWEDYCDSEGLKTRLIKYLRISEEILKTITIVDPSDNNTKTPFEQDVFKKIVKNIEEGDEIYLDITHSFRSIPIVAISVFDYLYYLKGIELKMILYGAFEAKKEDIAPIHDITYMYETMKWSGALNVFLKFGFAKELVKQIEFHNNRAYKKNYSEEEKEKIKKTRGLLKKLDKITSYFYTVRGNQIEKENFNEIIKEMEEAKKLELLNFVSPLIDKVIDKIKPFENDDFKGLYAVEWCLNNNLIQQGITFLQEWILTFILKEISFDYKKEKNRKNLSDLIHKISKDGENKWKENFEGDLDGAKEIYSKIKDKLENSTTKELFRIHESMREKRNDINHGGYKEKAIKSEKFSNELKSALNRLKNLLLKEN